MISINTFFIFTITSVLANSVPGPSMLFVASRSISYGREKGIVSAFGLTTGLLFHIICASLGISTIFIYSPIAFSIFKYLGAAYLIYTGITMLFDHEELFEGEEKKGEIKSKNFFIQGVLTEVLNPKTSLFFISLLPQFVNHGKGHISFQMLILGFIFLFVSLSRDLFVAYAGDRLSLFFKTRKFFERLTKIITGSLFISTGIGLAFKSK